MKAAAHHRRWFRIRLFVAVVFISLGVELVIRAERPKQLDVDALTE